MRILITGGAGFIGTNLAVSLAERGEHVTIFDNLSRGTAQQNIRLIRQDSPAIAVVIGDVSDARAVSAAADGQDAIYHLAGQVAVTASLQDPRADFQTNALGTFNVLEAARKHRIPLIYTSTNKVYGNNVNRVPIEEHPLRYEFSNELKGKGIPESFPIDAQGHTPYGSSKLAGDVYVQDYSHVYGVPTVVNRMSCIYGVHQHGTADQGWIAHFIQTALKGAPLTIYGDGKQVRDVLFVDDLVRLLHAELEHIDAIPGEVFNVGGGPQHTISLLEFLGILRKLGADPPVSFSDWRSADQKVYYSDISKVKDAVGWAPRITPEDGIARLYEWAKTME